MNLEQDDPNSGIPWGRPPVPALPVPPFADRHAARAFMANLSAYVALLGGDVPVTPPTFALLSTVQQELDKNWALPFDPLPSPQILTVAMVTYFPAPWTPHGLNEVAYDVFVPDHWPQRTTPGHLGWNSDPYFSATRSDAGEWEVTASERGNDRVAGRFSTDDDMVLYRMSFARGHPMPFGYEWDTSNVDALARAADTARAAWSRHAPLPYISNWRH